MSDVDGTVVAIQGRDVSDAAPADKDVMTWDQSTGEWGPAAAPQPMEPWVGAVNTQQKVIKRIPFTCRVNGDSLTGVYVPIVSVTLPTSTGAIFRVHFVGRVVNGPWAGGVATRNVQFAGRNVGGTISLSDVEPTYSTSPGVGSAYNPVVSPDISGTTVVVRLFGSTDENDLDVQGYVDLMVV